MEPSSSLLEATLPSAHATVTAGDHIHVVEEHEPFDSKLFARLKDLARQEEDLTETVARLRRVNPEVAVEHARKDWTQGRAEEDAALGVWDEESQTRERMATGLDVAMLERREEVEHASRRSVKHLENLARTLPETVAKKERADRAEAYVRKTAGT